MLMRAGEVCSVTPFILLGLEYFDSDTHREYTILSYFNGGWTKWEKFTF